MSKSPMNTIGLDHGPWPPTGASDKPVAAAGVNDFGHIVPQQSGWGKVGTLKPRQQSSPRVEASEGLVPYTHVDTQIADTLLKAGANKDAPIRAPSSSTKHRPGLGSIDTFFGGAPQASLHSTSAPAAAQRQVPGTTGYSPTQQKMNDTSGLHSRDNSQSKGKAKDVDPQEYQTYTQELEKMFGKQGDMDVSVSRLRDPTDSATRESFVIGRVKGAPPKGKSKTRPNPAPFIVEKKFVPPMKGNSSRGVAPHASSSRSKEGHPPKPRQDFEEISRRVVESTPDKTVTISTWREQVAQETTVEGDDGSMERISVYYVSGHAPADALANATAELEDLGERPAPAPPPVVVAAKDKVVQEPPQVQHTTHTTTMTSQPLAEIMALSPEQDNSMVYPSPETNLEDSRLLDEHVEHYHRSPMSRGTAAPSWIRPSQYLPSTVVNAIRDHQRPSSSRYFSPSSPASSLPPQSPADRKERTIHSHRQYGDDETSFDDDDDDESESRSPPSQFPPTPPPKMPPTLPRLKTGSKLMQSTPVVSAFAMPSFHPTRDGSVISSIVSGDLHLPSHIVQSPDHVYPSPRPSMSPEDMKMQGRTNTLEGVLNSCRPSLRHLMPTLAHLGITTKEHLHALAELDSETRDRELKEEALRGGVTNMEWAMLMNRLKSL